MSTKDYAGLANKLADEVNFDIQAGVDPDEALHNVIAKSKWNEDTQADLFSYIWEAWGGANKHLPNHTVEVYLIKVDYEQG